MKIISFVVTGYGHLVRRKVGVTNPGIRFNMDDKLQMVEFDTVSTKSCMREVGCRSLACFDVVTNLPPLRLKTINKLLLLCMFDIDIGIIFMSLINLAYLRYLAKFFDVTHISFVSLIVVDENVDVNWQSKKKYIDTFDVTVIT
ncbi:hypothetical protein Tco_0774488 [Tanacetum coccineum]|uniref:Uncharacterized protein n=1 Tax=Tanacetum coccineum TaxID=301880 RepID=A0ABQ4ZRR8_9ASTR